MIFEENIHLREFFFTYNGLKRVQGSTQNASILTSSNSEFHLKIKESLLIARDKPELNRNENKKLIVYVIIHGPMFARSF